MSSSLPHWNRETKNQRAANALWSAAVKSGSRAAVLSQTGAPLSWTNERAASLGKQPRLSRRCWLRESEEGSG
jgi:hypothetical protein